MSYVGSRPSRSSVTSGPAQGAPRPGPHLHLCGQPGGGRHPHHRHAVPGGRGCPRQRAWPGACAGDARAVLRGCAHQGAEGRLAAVQAGWALADCGALGPAPPAAARLARGCCPWRSATGSHGQGSCRNPALQECKRRQWRRTQQLEDQVESVPFSLQAGALAVVCEPAGAPLRPAAGSA